MTVKMEREYQRFINNLHVACKKNNKDFRDKKTVRSLSEIVKIFYDTGYNFMGIFIPELIYTKPSTEKIIEGVYAYIDRECLSIQKDLKDVCRRAGITKKQASFILEGTDIKFTTLLAILKELKIDILDSPMYLLKIGKEVTDKEAEKICLELSDCLKRKRLRENISLPSFNLRGNISATTARRIEKNCSKVSLKKLIAYMTAIGVDALTMLGKVSTSYDSDLRIIEFYNALYSYRAAAEIHVGTIACQLRIPKEKVQRCENYRANISVEDMIKWALTLDVFTYSYRNM